MRILLCFLFLTNILSGQKAEVLELRTTFWGHGFKLEGKKVSLSDVEQYLIQNNYISALPNIKAGNEQQVASNLFGLPGGFLLGYEFANIILGEKFNGITASIGVGLTMVSVLFSKASKKNYQSAINKVKNSQLIGFGATQSGNIGMYVDF